MHRAIVIMVGLGLSLPLTAQQPPASTDGAKEKKAAKGKAKVGDAIKEIAGSAEFLRNVPKKFAELKSVDAWSVTLLIEGDKEATTWPITPDAELKVNGWWGRAEQFKGGQRVWVWFSVDRSKRPKAVFMIADEATEKEIHGLAKANPKKPEIVDQDKMDALRKTQQQWLRQRWQDAGLPGTVGFLHVYSGETDVILDHEAMRWTRSLSPGDKVEVLVRPRPPFPPGPVAVPSPIKAVVKTVAAQREKTQVRLVIHSLDLGELQTGYRVDLKMKAPPAEIESAQMPPDIDRPKEKSERIEWFLANIYCTCGVGGDICTGHFYTLASCNPNGCGAPNGTRAQIGALIDQGMTNRQIFEELLRDRGPAMLRPHLLR